MRFGILGPLQAVGDDGRELALGGRMPRAVLALLLLRANEVVSSDQLVEELWAGARRRRAARRGCTCTCIAAATQGPLPPATQTQLRGAAGHYCRWLRLESRARGARCASMRAADRRGSIATGGGTTRSGARRAERRSSSFGAATFGLTFSTTRLRRARSRGWTSCVPRCLRSGSRSKCCWAGRRRC